jgi:hypothetical protein
MLPKGKSAQFIGKGVRKLGKLPFGGPNLPGAGDEVVSLIPPVQELEIAPVDPTLGGNWGNVDYAVKLYWAMDRLVQDTLHALNTVIGPPVAGNIYKGAEIPAGPKNPPDWPYAPQPDILTLSLPVPNFRWKQSHLANATHQLWRILKSVYSDLPEALASFNQKSSFVRSGACTASTIAPAATIDMWHLIGYFENFLAKVDPCCGGQKTSDYIRIPILWCQGHDCCNEYPNSLYWVRPFEVKVRTSAYAYMSDHPGEYCPFTGMGGGPVNHSEAVATACFLYLVSLYNVLRPAMFHRYYTFYDSWFDAPIPGVNPVYVGLDSGQMQVEPLDAVVHMAGSPVEANLGASSWRACEPNDDPPFHAYHKTGTNSGLSWAFRGGFGIRVNQYIYDMPMSASGRIVEVNDDTRNRWCNWIAQVGAQPYVDNLLKDECAGVWNIYQGPSCVPPSTPHSTSAPCNPQPWEQGVSVFDY